MSGAGSDVEIIAESGAFDEDFYRSQVPSLRC